MNLSYLAEVEALLFFITFCLLILLFLAIPAIQAEYFSKSRGMCN